MKKYLFPVFLVCILMSMLWGCTVTNMETGESTPVEYTVVPEDDLPREILNLIDNKKEQDFQMTYQDGEDLYLIRGYGRQDMSGYSIQVEELSRGEEAIMMKTNLIGPSPEDKAANAPSYPYIVIKIPYQDIPVQFQ